MARLYPDVEPYANGMLQVAPGELVYWETCGNPKGKPALVLHGGPGSGCAPWWRRLCDPARYRIVLFDQRNCGRSRPRASDPGADLSANTTEHLLADIEKLRAYLAVERWLVLGGSWGSALALTYAETFTERVTELVLFGVTTGRREEFDWLFRDGLARFFPDAWERRRAALPESLRGGDVVDAYWRWLNDPDPIEQQSAARAWCTWESATPDWPPRSELASRFHDPVYALTFARIVTHYVRHDAWLGDGRVLRDIGKLSALPGVLINGRFDFQAPLATAWQLQRAWPNAQLIAVDGAGHSAGASGISGEIVNATDRFAKTWD